VWLFGLNRSIPRPIQRNTNKKTDKEREMQEPSKRLTEVVEQREVGEPCSDRCWSCFEKKGKIEERKCENQRLQRPTPEQPRQDHRPTHACITIGRSVGRSIKRRRRHHHHHRHHLHLPLRFQTPSCESTHTCRPRRALWRCRSWSCRRGSRCSPAPRKCSRYCSAAAARGKRKEGGGGWMVVGGMCRWMDGWMDGSMDE
jgi:hypothetical protein